MVGGGNHSLPSKEKASEQVRIALSKRHGGTKKGNIMLHGANAWYKSKDYYGNKWKPVGKMVNNFSSGEFYPFYRWNIHKPKAAFLSSLFLFNQKQDDVLEKKKFILSNDQI